MIVDIHCMNCKDRIYTIETKNMQSPLRGYMFRLPRQMEWPLPGTQDEKLDLTCPMCGYTFHNNETMLYFGVVEMGVDEAKELFEFQDAAELKYQARLTREIMTDDEMALYMFSGKRQRATQQIMNVPDKISISKRGRKALRKAMINAR